MILGMISQFRIYLILGLVIVVLGVGFYAYARWTRAEMANLQLQLERQQERADALEAAQQALLADVAAVRRAQEDFTRTAAAARSRASAESRALRERDFRSAATGDRGQLEAEANASFEDAFRKLEEASRAR